MHMAIDSHRAGGHTDVGGAGAPAASGHVEGSATRRRILEIALSLMSQRGVDGTSMRDLASAADLNVASLYHYFPSKRDLLESVLVEQGLVPITNAGPDGEGGAGPTEWSSLSDLLADMMASMFEVQDFVRLMVGEAIRGESTARAVGLDLFTTFQDAIEGWVTANRPDLVERGGAAEVARLLGAMVVGVFISYAAGVLAEDDAADTTALSLRRAREAATILSPPE
jgi:AcrR family transcriptional regulator